MTKQLIEKYRKEIGDYNSGNYTILELVKKAHKKLKENFTYTTDEINYGNEISVEMGVYDIWRMKTDDITTVEDCDGFTLKLLWLLSTISNIPKDKLFYTTGLSFTGEGHAMPVIMDEKGILWQADNQLDGPIPAYYIYNSLGGKVNKKYGVGGIMCLDDKIWHDYKPKNIKEPKLTLE